MKTVKLFLKLFLCLVITHLHASAQDLPPGVPRCIETDGTVYINPLFTTKAYQREAFRLVLQEANIVAKELKLPEKLPIMEADLTAQFIGPFGDGYMKKRIGNVTTRNYSYNVAQGNKFSDLNIANYDQTCFKLKERGRISMSQINTNTAYQLATQWLTAVGIDIKAMNRECQVVVKVNDFWNSPKPGEKSGDTFIPIYDVFWISRQNQSKGFGNVGYVQLFAPTKMLLQLSIRNPNYILRKPLVFTNLASLFPGRALIVTNSPQKVIEYNSRGLD